MSAPIAGGCNCGAVRFSLSGPGLEIVNCHCGQCRRFHGHYAPYVNGVPTSQVSFITEHGLRWYQSSSFAHRGFCGLCGSAMFWQRLGSNKIDIAAGCLDAPTGLKMARHIYVAHRGDYYELADDLEQWPDGEAPG